jgi:hypothetical protein
MNIEISFDASRVLARLDDAIARGQDMHDTMPAEFSAWQEEDMGRRQADTQTPHADTVSTIIKPRGRGRPPRRVGSRRRPGQKPPILRPELKIKLQERMRALLKRTFAPWA